MKERSYQAWKPLQPGAIIDLIAPAGRCPAEALQKVDTLLHHWQLIPRRDPKLLGDDLLCANSDEERFSQLKQALYNTDSSAVWCLRGGYGCTRLIPNLLPVAPPTLNKLFIGFSDITTLHLFYNNNGIGKPCMGLPPIKLRRVILMIRVLMNSSKLFLANCLN
ncbi:LD-carboxypeptidase [Rickettsiella massiliensis]|uniref:LD-carboxypeptidase n=1 Tax=Rickettsiella massiliensis TaxID=676517 RepID=UPI00029A6DE5|nr:LD-carboxypeptidase [Rickettsiella massiliensis]